MQYIGESGGWGMGIAGGSRFRDLERNGGMGREKVKGEREGAGEKGRCRGKGRCS